MHDPAEFCDIAHHKKNHENATNGIQIRLTNNDFIVMQQEEKYKLILVDSSATRGQIKRLNILSKFINTSLPRGELFSYHIQLDYPLKSEKKFFLLCLKGRIVGYLDIELTSKGLDSPIWLIKMIWLAVNYRNKGLAKTIVDSSVKFLNLDLTSVGWEVPFSELGLAFVQSLCPNGFRTFQTNHFISVG